MRELEKTQSDLCGLTKETRQDLSFVRAGRAGGWKAELDDALAAAIEAAWAPLMTRLGYELHSQRAVPPKDSGAVDLLLNVARS
jgi:hypothetical protein